MKIEKLLIIKYSFYSDNTSFLGRCTTKVIEIMPYLGFIFYVGKFKFITSN